MLPVKSMRVLNFQDPQLRSLQDAISTALNPVLATAILDGNTLEGVELSTTPIIIAHGLKRNFRGYIVTSQNAAEVIYLDSEQSRPSSQIVLRASGAVTANLVVF